MELHVDSKEIYKAILMKNYHMVTIMSLLEEIHKELTKIGEVRINHVFFMEANKCGDGLAKLGTGHSQCISGMYECLREVYKF